MTALKLVGTGWRSRSAWAVLCCTVLVGQSVRASDADGPAPPPLVSRDVLSAEAWVQVDRAVDLALVFLARHQEPNGQFLAPDMGQPAVTGLCILAFLSRGHLPGEGPYGEVLRSAVEFMLSCQQPDGLLSIVPPGPRMQPHTPSHTGVYNHAIGGLVLSELYGMTGLESAPRIRSAVDGALVFTRRLQLTPKRSPAERGGWRYLRPWEGVDSDLSVTSWQLLFLRSAKNAGFEVPSEYIDEAMQFVHRCFDPAQGTFTYSALPIGRSASRAMAGAGILSFSLGGLHDTEYARSAGEWILQHPFDPYLGDGGRKGDTRYFYGAFYCSQAMYQLGGRYWVEFYPRLVATLLAHQSSSGSWGPEPADDERYGIAYATALAVLALTTPHQLLPIYQR